MKLKVFLDTNVLVAASIRVVISEQRIDVKHLFFDTSTTLMLLIQKHVDKRIGLVTARIETEAHNVLESAVLKELQRAGVDFTSLSPVLDICGDNLRRLESQEMPTMHANLGCVVSLSETTQS